MKFTHSTRSLVFLGVCVGTILASSGCKGGAGTNPSPTQTLPSPEQTRPLAGTEGAVTRTTVNGQPVVLWITDLSPAIGDQNVEPRTNAMVTIMCSAAQTTITSMSTNIYLSRGSETLDDLDNRGDLARVFGGGGGAFCYTNASAKQQAGFTIFQDGRDRIGYMKVAFWFNMGMQPFPERIREPDVVIYQAVNWKRATG